MPRRLTLTGLCDEMRRHGTVFVPGAAAEPVGLIRALETSRALSEGLDLLTSLLPGVNRLDIAALHSSARVRGLFAHAALQKFSTRASYGVLPVSYGGFVRDLSGRQSVASLVVQVTPPDKAGHCNLGPAAEFLTVILRQNPIIYAVVNPHVPSLPGGLSLPFEHFEAFAEDATPLASYEIGPPSDTLRRIAANTATLVKDGCTLQLGLGKVPAALAGMLESRRGLRLFSGMLSDGLLHLAAQGCLDMDACPVTCALLGSEKFYQQLAGYEHIQMRGCEITHNARLLAEIDRFIAINSTLELDLLGQCNSEMSNHIAISGAGGAPEFARAARQSRGGRSVITLESSAKDGSISRIVPRLGQSACCTLPRYDVDTVVTEFGVADLKGLTVTERANAIIQVAHPKHREFLVHEWQKSGKPHEALARG